VDSDTGQFRAAGSMDLLDQTIVAVSPLGRQNSSNRNKTSGANQSPPRDVESGEPSSPVHKLRTLKRGTMGAFTRIRSRGKKDVDEDVIADQIDAFSGVVDGNRTGSVVASMSVSNQPHWQDERRFRTVEARRQMINMNKQLKTDDAIRAEHSLFLSHSWRDEDTQARKRQLIACLSADRVDEETGKRQQGWTYWADFLNLQAEGPVPWRKEIEEGIRDCAKFVAFIDTEYLLSFNCLQEVQFAIDYRKPIVPVILDQGAWDILTSVQGARTAWSRSPKAGESLFSFDGKFMTGTTNFSYDVLERLLTQLASINFCPARPLEFRNLGEAGVMSLLREYAEKDLSYLKEYSELHKKAVVWAARGKPDDPASLLVGEEIEDWTSWLRLAHNYNLHPQPVALQEEFVKVSHRKSSQARKRRHIAFVSLIVLILMGACASIALAVAAESSRAELQVRYTKEEQLNTQLQELNEDLDRQAQVLDEKNSELEERGREVRASLRRVTETNNALEQQIARNRVITRERMIATLFLLVKGQSPEEPSELRAAVQACNMARTLNQSTAVTPLLYPILSHVTRKRAWKTGEFVGHSDGVLFVVESPDGALVATGSLDGTVGLWDFSDPGAVPGLRLLEGKHTPAPGEPGISAIAWSADSRMLVSAAYTDPVAWLWTFGEGGPADDDAIPLVGHSAGVSTAAMSPAGAPIARVATASFDLSVRLWGIDGGELAVLHGHAAGIVCLEWAPDGERLASASDDDALVIVWDLRGDTPPAAMLTPLRGHAGWVNSVAWRPDGEWLASGSDDQTVALWSTPTNGSAPSLDRQLAGHEGFVNDVAWAPDGLALASASYDHTVRVWKFASGSAGSGVRGERRPISSSSSNRSGAASVGLDVVSQHVLVGHQGYVMNVAWAPDGRLSSASQDGTARVWETQGATPWMPRVPSTVLGGHGDLVWATAWSADYRHLYTVAADKSISRWDTQPSKSSPVLELEGNPRGISTAAAFARSAPDMVAVQDDSAVLVWNVSTQPPQQLARLEGHTSAVSSIAWPPLDARLLATGDRDNYTVIVWCPGCPAQGRVAATLRSSDGASGGVDALRWSPDGAMLAWSSLADSDGPLDVMVWRSPTAADGDSSDALVYLRGHRSGITRLAWAPDSSRRLAAAAADRTVHVWLPTRDSESQPMLSFDSGHGDYVWDIDWSPDGSMLVTASWDGTVAIFRLTPNGGAVLPRQVIAAHGGASVFHAQFGPEVADGALRLATAADDGSVLVHSVPAEGNVTSVEVGRHLEEVVTMEWSPSGKWLATGSFDGKIQVWFMTMPRLQQQQEGEGAEAKEELPESTAEQSLMLDTLLPDAEDPFGADDPFMSGVLASRSDVRAVTSVAWSADEQHILATTRLNPQVRRYDVGFCTLERKIAGLTAGHFDERDLRSMNLKWLAADIFSSQEVLDAEAAASEAVC